MSSVRFVVYAGDALGELDRLADGPSPATIAGLESVLAESFAETQMVVHIITGSLKASGKIESDYADDEWSGLISYGGVSPGSVHDPVDYSRAERERGGIHDFLAPALAASGRYGEVIGNWLRGTP